MKITKTPLIKALVDVQITDYDAVLVPCNKELSMALVDGTIDIPALSGLDILSVASLLAKSKSFKGEAGQIISLPTKVGDSSCVSVVFFGIDTNGVNVDFSDSSASFRAGGLARCALPASCKRVIIAPPSIGSKSYVVSPACLLDVASGLADACYSFAPYITDEKKLETVNTVAGIDICASIDNNLVSEANGIITSVAVTKDLVNCPPNDLFPKSYSDFISSYFDGADGVSIRTYDARELEQMGFHMLLGVGQGSHLPPYVAVMQYNGDSKRSGYDVSLVGKGITFDSGGLSIKPANYMMTMKTDMAGSAAVVGTIKALSKNRAKVNVVGIVGLVENAVGGNAQRPSDIVKSLSGKTVEILNTDAEGRLVLGDLLTFAQREFRPRYIVDLATLTGAITVGLGEFYAGLFSNSDTLSVALMNAGNATGEKLYRMPLGSEYSDMLKSPIADIKNISGTGMAGSTTAAEFLKFFIDGDTKWAHLDIAGTAYLEKSYPSSHKKLATAFGVRLLYNMLSNNAGGLL